MTLNPQQFVKVRHHSITEGPTPPVQLPMFVPAKHLVDGTIGRFNKWDLGHVEYESEYPGADGKHYTEFRPQTVEEGWEQKREEGWESGLYHSVAEEGVRKPVKLYGGPPTEADTGFELGTIADGHHRAVVAYDMDPDTEVPVLWRGRTRGGSGRQHEGTNLYYGSEGWRRSQNLRMDLPVASYIPYGD